MAGEHAKITTSAAAYCGICGKSYDRDTQTGRDGAANRKENNIMSTKNSNKLNVPEAKAAMDQFKMQAANEVGVFSPQKNFPHHEKWLYYWEIALSESVVF